MLHIKAKASWQSQVGLAKPAWLLWPSAARDLWFGGFTLLSFSSSLTHQTQQQRAAQPLLSAEEAGVSVCRLILKTSLTQPSPQPSPSLIAREGAGQPQLSPPQLTSPDVGHLQGPA